MADHVEVWDDRKAALQVLLGKADDQVLTAAPPLHLGGFADVLTFRDHVDGVTYVTAGLTGVDGIQQVPSALIGNYELMICVRPEASWATAFFDRLAGRSRPEASWPAELISKLARHTLKAELNPSATMNLPRGQIPGLKESKIQKLLFTEPILPGFDFGGRAYGLLLCMGITTAEFNAIRNVGYEPLVKALKAKHIFPFFDLKREGLSAAELQALAG